MKNAEGNRQIVYAIEDNGDGLSTVFVPIAPTGKTGPVKVDNPGNTSQG